ncbi:MAG: HEAT repeat domain-containing protein [Candidatus Aminicenantes bacterium]|jgi:HEAT repeat protein
MNKRNFLFFLLFPFLSCILCGFHINAASKLSEDKLKALRSAKTLRVIVEQSYGKASDVKVPLQDMIKSYLKNSGLGVVGSDSKNFDITIRIQVEGEAIGKYYTLKDFCYSGARIWGTVVLEKDDMPYIKDTFKGEIKCPSRIKKENYRKPADAPFVGAFQEPGSFLLTFIKMMGEVFGHHFLINSAKSEDWRVRRDSVILLGETKDPKTIKLLIEFLKERNKNVRQYVEKTLIKTGKLAVESLIDALNSKDRHIRRQASMILGEIKDPSAVMPLISLYLWDNYYFVSRNVEEALLKIGKSSIQSLIPALNSENLRVRKEISEILAKINKPGLDAVEPLLSLLMKERDENVRKNIVVALGKMKDSQAVEPLITLLKGDKSRRVRESSIKALGEIKDPRAVKPLLEALQDRNFSIRSSAGKAFTKIGDQALQPLIAALKDKNPEVREIAIVTLGDLRDSRAVEPLITKLKDGNPKVRKTSAETLGKLKDPRTIDHLIAALLDDNSDVREYAAIALGEIGDSRAVERLIAALHDIDISVRESVATALGKIGDSRAVKPLIAALIKDSFWSVRAAAAKALGWLRDPAAVVPLLIALKINESVCEKDVLHYANYAIKRIGYRAITPLISVLKNETDWHVQIPFSEMQGPRKRRYTAESLISALRVTAAKMLGELKHRRAVVPLIFALKDMNSNVRETAAWALGKIKDPRAIGQLIAALGDINKGVRESAAWALGGIKDPRAVGPLISALTDSNSDVRKYAAYALKDIGDIRAVKPLVKVLRDKDEYVRDRAADALDKLNWKPKNDTEKAAYLYARGKYDALAKLGEPGLEVLVHALKDINWSIREKVAKVLEKVKWKPKDNKEKAFYLIAKEDFKQLTKLGKPAVEPLVEMLPHGLHFYRCDVIETLGEIGDKRAVEILIASLKDNERFVQRDAVKALGRIKDARAVEPLIVLLNNGDQLNPYVRLNTIEALGEIGDPRALEPLIELLNDKDGRVQWGTASSLKLITGKDFGKDYDKWKKWWKENRDKFINIKNN